MLCLTEVSLRLFTEALMTGVYGAYGALCQRDSSRETMALVHQVLSQNAPLSPFVYCFHGLAQFMHNPVYFVLQINILLTSKRRGYF